MPNAIGPWIIKILRVAIPVSYLVFLLTSITHLAWFFSIYDNDWLVQYGLATAIDLTCFVLSVYAMFFYASLSRTNKWVVWGLVIILSLFSWMANYEYALYHQSAEIFKNPKLIPFADINALIASAFVVFGIVYNKLGHSLTAKPRTAEDIQAEANDIANRINAETALRTARQQMRTAKGTVAEKIVAATREATSAIQQSSTIVVGAIKGNVQTTPTTSDESEQGEGKGEDGGKVEQEGGQDETEQEAVNETPQSHRPFTVVPGSGKRKPHTVKGARETDLSISIETVAKELGLSTAQVTRLAQNKDCLLTATRRNKKMITKASFAAYKKAKAETEAS